MALSEDWLIWYTKAVETETHSLVPGRSAACLAGNLSGSHIEP